MDFLGNSMTKPNIESISIVEIRDNPVWRFANGPHNDGIKLMAVKKLPCANLVGRVVGTQLRFADGSLAWGFLGNIDVSNPRLTQHFVTVSVEKMGRWFHLARYHDFDFENRSPERLAEFLGKEVDEVFPIEYDVTSISQGERNALAGLIRKEPEERLSRAEIIALAVP